MALRLRPHTKPVTPTPERHSAGGTLVLWLAAQPGLAAAVKVRLVVAVAPVADLVQGCRPRLTILEATQGQILSQSPTDATSSRWHLYGS